MSDLLARLGARTERQAEIVGRLSKTKPADRTEFNAGLDAMVDMAALHLLTKAAPVAAELRVNLRVLVDGHYEKQLASTDDEDTKSGLGEMHRACLRILNELGA